MLIEPQGVSAWMKETAQIRLFMLSPFLLLNHLETQSSKAKLSLPTIPIGIAECALHFCTHSHGDLQFVLSEIERERVKAPLAAVISSYLIPLTHPTYTWNVGGN